MNTDHQILSFAESQLRLSDYKWTILLTKITFRVVRMTTEPLIYSYMKNSNNIFEIAKFLTKINTINTQNKFQFQSSYSRKRRQATKYRYFQCPKSYFFSFYWCYSRYLIVKENQNKSNMELKILEQIPLPFSKSIVIDNEPTFSYAPLKSSKVHLII